MKKFVTYLSTTAVILFSLNANGSLVFDGTYITGDGQTYLGLNMLAGSTYAETVTATSTGGVYADYRIATTADADNFINSLFNGTATCVPNGTPDFFTDCGNITGWYNGRLGDNFNESIDYALFLSDGTADAGFLEFLGNGTVSRLDNWGTFNDADIYSNIGYASSTPMSWLLVLDTTTPPAPPANVPEPSILALFGLGIAGFGFIRRRKSTQA